MRDRAVRTPNLDVELARARAALAPPDPAEVARRAAQDRFRRQAAAEDEYAQDPAVRHGCAGRYGSW